MAERKRKPNKPEVVSRAVHKYVKTHYDRVDFQIPSGMRDVLREHAKASGARSLQQWIASVLEKETGLDLVLRGDFGPQSKPKEDSKKDDDEGSAE